jgi:hypothetical protein
MRVYVDTSVIGGCMDEEFKEWSLRLVQEFMAGRKIAVISDLTRSELDQAPEAVKEVLSDLSRSQWEAISLNEEAKELANAYVREGVVGLDCLADALHIAVATLARVDVLVSWNFKHIVNLRRIHLYNAVNLKAGHGMIDIRTPREVLDAEGL